LVTDLVLIVDEQPKTISTTAKNKGTYFIVI
jgi:hypothetical protein